VLFARNRARISVVDIDAAGATETVRMVAGVGGEAVAVVADVSRREDVDSMVAATVDHFGGLDILYNNAAVQMSGRLLECTEEQWDLTVATNLTAIFRACRAAIPHMLAGDGGSIINTASVLGLIGSEGYCAYGVAKAGLVSLTRQIAVEYGPRIRANVIAPGSIDTPRFRKVLDGVDDPVKEPTRQLLDERSAAEVRTLGLALRFAYTLCGGTTDFLSDAWLYREENSLVLEIPPSGSLYVGEAVQRRLQILAGSLGATPVVRRREVRG